MEPASPEVLLSRKAALQLGFPTPGQTAPLLVSAPPPMLRGEQSWAGGCKLGFVWLGPSQANLTGGGDCVCTNTHTCLCSLLEQLALH